MPRKSKRTAEKKEEKKVSTTSGKTHKVRKVPYKTYIQRIAKKNEVKLNPDCYQAIADYLDFINDKVIDNINLGSYGKTIDVKTLKCNLEIFCNSRDVDKDGIKSILAAGTTAVETFQKH